MDAKLRKIQITPMKFDKDGEIQKKNSLRLPLKYQWIAQHSAPQL